MSDNGILLGIREALAEVLDVPLGSIHPDDKVVEDLGADSLDLLDLTFHLEQRFKIPVSPREAERRAKAALGGKPLEVDGVYTPEALVELRKSLPDIPPGELADGLTVAELPRRFSVRTLAGLVERMLKEKHRG